MLYKEYREEESKSRSKNTPRKENGHGLDKDVRGGKTFMD